MIAPKPPSRPEKVSLWRYLRLFRQDILSAQPAKLYRAWMAEFKTPFFRSYLINQPELVREVLRDRPDDFPKSDRISEGLRPLLGRESVFLTNGETWKRQRRIIDPAFERGRIKEIYPAVLQASERALAELTELRDGDAFDAEEFTSRYAADVIFRTLFSVPIDDDAAQKTYTAFRAYQRAQPILNVGAFIKLPSWMPRLFRGQAKKHAAEIRLLIRQLTEKRAAQLAQGDAPDDLATRLMQFRDEETGQGFDVDEMIDQVAIFFLAGHETSAASLAWAFYLLATDDHWQGRVAGEASNLTDNFSTLSTQAAARDVFKETLRLYPPVPMMVRETTRQETFRNRVIAKGAQLVLSPWHLHRHERLWERPDHFDPTRWSGHTSKDLPKDAYMPFSAGQRVCPGASFAMVEAAVLISKVVEQFTLYPDPSRPAPIPQAHLTVRSAAGITLVKKKRES